MSMKILKVAVLALGAGVAWPAAADVTIGVTISSTGSGAALGIPMRNSVQLWPAEIAGEKLNVVLLDDAGDPSVATTNARRLVTENKADVLIGSALTPASIAVMGVAAETETPHLAGSPVPLQPGRDKWTFVMPQKVSLMADGLFQHMKKNNVKTIGFIGFSDSWGDLWINELKARGEGFGVKVVAEERYARADTSVSGQVLKLVAARPDAVLVGGSGTGAALPQIALRERGFRGIVYQTHGAVTNDFIRIAGKNAENAVFVSGPVMTPEAQPESSSTKAPGLAYVKAYEEKFGARTRTQFGAHMFDALEILKRAVPTALKTAKPGTKEFRAALRDAIESEKEIAVSQGVFNFKPDDHYGFDERARILLTVKDGNFVLAQ
jgi:branched-chain amino acid transport system substrate-binding protein